MSLCRPFSGAKSRVAGQETSFVSVNCSVASHVADPLQTASIPRSYTLHLELKAETNILAANTSNVVWSRVSRLQWDGKLQRDPGKSKTMNANTFTIQSVHGMTETFVVNPNGTVDTTQSHTNRDSVKMTDKPVEPAKLERKAAK